MVSAEEDEEEAEGVLHPAHTGGRKDARSMGNDRDHVHQFTMACADRAA
jgi:hypothetical protein